MKKGSKRNNILKDKHGDIPSLFLAVVSVMIAGIVIFVFSHLASEIYGTIGNYLENEPKYNDTQITRTLDTVEEYENSLWDYAFLAIAIGYLIMMGVLAFSTNISPIFYFIYALAAFFSFAIGVVMSNLWQSMVAMPEFATTAARFPITNLILGNFFPIYITVIMLITMILLFGKFFSGGGGLDG